jgi:hypothetical protein
MVAGLLAEAHVALDEFDLRGAVKPSQSTLRPLPEPAPTAPPRA